VFFSFFPFFSFITNFLLLFYIFSQIQSPRVYHSNTTVHLCSSLFDTRSDKVGIGKSCVTVLNLAMDDEEHAECGEDWISKPGSIHEPPKSSRSPTQAGQ
jgi:hypothetical protein